MINVSDELKQAVLHEVKPKNIKLEFSHGDITKFNWYKQDPTYGSVSINQDTLTIPAGGEIKLSSGIFSDNAQYVNTDYYDVANYIELNMGACFYNSNGLVSGDVFSVRVSFRRSNGSYYIIDTPNYQVSHFTNNAPRDIREERIYTPPILMHHETNGDFTNYYEVWLRNTSQTTPITLETYGFGLYSPMLSLQDEPNSRPQYTNLWASQENVDAELRDYLPPITNSNIIGESFVYKESICSSDTLKFGLCEASEIEIDVFDKNYDFTGRKMDLSLQFANIQDKFEWKDFVIAESKKSYAGDTQKRHIVAYDKLKDLNENAFAWYTQYMWGINTLREETYAPYCFDYERQIFATYWNLAKAFGVDKEENLTINHFGHYSFYASEVTTTRKLRYIDAGVYNHELWFEGTTLGNGNVGDHDALMVVVNLTPNRKSGTEYATFLQSYDSLGRGVETANVLLEFTVSGMTDTVNYLCDSGDVIIPPENWLYVNILSTSHLSIVGDAEDMADSYDVYTVDFKYLNALDLVNGTQRLPYHSYVWKKPTTENIFKADSSITARDVMRSLMEMCGCFFRLDREGHPQFLYAMEHGLYPSNTLFPADDLFPRKSSELTMPTSYYIKANFEEYRVSNFGGVQVVVNTYDSQGAVVRWEYWGDETSDNAYLIDDNIFLCNSQFEYEPEMAGNVQELLENLWNVLNNMSYTPFTAETIGTPFLESGDRFTLLTKTDGFESFIFERTLKGIQVLKDYYEARGVAKTPRVKNFEWGNTNE